MPPTESTATYAAVQSEMPISELRAHLGPVFEQSVRSGVPVLFSRNSSDHGLLLSRQGMARALDSVEFEPVVRFEGGVVNIWLEELLLLAEGDTFDEAVDDLVAQTREYIDEYLSDEALLASPNREGHFGHALKAMLADLDGKLEDCLLAEPN